MHNVKSRAMYGIDVMLSEDGTPVLLEATFNPEQSYNVTVKEGLVDSLFGLMFLGEEGEKEGSAWQWERVRPSMRQ